MERTLDALFTIAIQLERKAEAIYRRWQAGFSHVAEAAEFWQRYAEDEAQHARYLEQVRDRLTPEQLAQPADKTIFDTASRLLSEMTRNVPEVRNLADAFTMAHYLEQSEVNMIFEFLAGNALPSEALSAEEGVQTVRQQLAAHTGRLSNLPASLQGVHSQRAVKFRE